MTKKEKKSIFWKCSPIPDIVRSKLTINSQWVKRYTSSRPNIIVNPLVNNTDNNLRNFTQVWGGRASSVYRPERTVWKHDHQTRRLVFACLTRSKSRIQNGSHISRRGIRRSHEKTTPVKPATHFEIYTPIAAIGKYRPKSVPNAAITIFVNSRCKSPIPGLFDISDFRW